MKLTKIEFEKIIREEIHEAIKLPKFKKFEIPGAEGLRTLADGLDKAFEEIYALKQRIKYIEEKNK